MPTGLPVESEFNRDIYNSVSSLIDPATVAAALQQIYGDELATPNYRLPLREPRERRLAHQFMFIHGKVLAEKEHGQARSVHFRNKLYYPDSSSNRSNNAVSCTNTFVSFNTAPLQIKHL